MNSVKVILFAFNILLLSTFLAASVDESDEAKLLVSKNVLNNYLVEGSDITVKYNIYNVGNVAAVSVKLVDDNFPADQFEYVSGFRSVKWSKVSPSGNVSHVAVVRPKVMGLFNLTHATVSYLSNEKSDKVQIGYSTEHGQAYILNLKEYNRKFASHTIDWIVFVVFAAPSILFPFLMWYNSKNKYEAAGKSAKKAN